jgi:GNAT superfamily N-acetyltransferase
MNAPVELEADDAPQIAAFTRVACAYDLLSTTSVRRSIFADAGPQIVYGLFDGGLDAVGVGVVRGVRGWVKLLAVHPRVRRQGIGSALLERIEGWCTENGASSVEVGNSAPCYVSPGVDVRTTESVCFYEARGYKRYGEAVDLSIRLSGVPEPARATRVATRTDLDRLLVWVEKFHPNWVDELTRAVELESCVVCDDIGFACVDVNREGLFGPTATHPDHRGEGVGTATLRAALHLLRARGHEHATISWAAALPFYVKNGALISRVYWWYRRELEEASRRSARLPSRAAPS